MITLNIKNNIEDLARLAPFIDEVAEAFDIAPDITFQLNLALDEALANSVDYAYPAGTEGSVILEADKTEDVIIFRLIDEGAEFDPTQGGNDVDTTLSAENRPIGGLGIFLIKQMMDEMIYERKENKNILTLKKQIK